MIMKEAGRIVTPSAGQDADIAYLIGIRRGQGARVWELRSRRHGYNADWRCRRLQQALAGWREHASRHQQLPRGHLPRNTYPQPFPLPSIGRESKPPYAL